MCHGGSTCLSAAHLKWTVGLVVTRTGDTVNLKIQTGKKNGTNPKNGRDIWILGCAKRTATYSLDFFNILCTVFVEAADKAHTVSERNAKMCRCVSLPGMRVFFRGWFPPSQGAVCGCWGSAVLVGWQTLCCPCPLMRKVKLEWNQPMRPSLAPVAVDTHCCIFSSWPLLISLLPLQPFMTLPCVITAPRWGYASLEGKREGETDKGVMEVKRQRTEERAMKGWTDNGSKVCAWRYKRLNQSRLMSLICFFLFSASAVCFCTHIKQLLLPTSLTHSIIDWHIAEMQAHNRLQWQ